MRIHVDPQRRSITLFEEFASADGPPASYSIEMGYHEAIRLAGTLYEKAALIEPPTPPGRTFMAVEGR